MRALSLLFFMACAQPDDSGAVVDPDVYVCAGGSLSIPMESPGVVTLWEQRTTVWLTITPTIQWANGYASVSCTQGISYVVAQGPR